MKLAILSRKRSLYSTRRLLETASARGHEAEAVDFLRCVVDITSRRPRLLYRGEAHRPDAAIPRIGATHTFYGMAVVRQLEAMGVPTVVASSGLQRARDKLRCLQALAAAGVDMPVTGFAHSAKDVDGLIELAGGPPLVIKLLEGTHGIGVVLAETKKAAVAVIEAFRGLHANLLVQEYVPEAAESDLRVIVVDGMVVAAMRRRAAPGEFRANLHRGGHAEPYAVSQEVESIALEATAALGLAVAGVDVIDSARGPLVIEVNASPGLEGVERASGADVAGAIVSFAERLAEAGRSGA